MTAGKCIYSSYNHNVRVPQDVRAREIYSGTPLIQTHGPVQLSMLRGGGGYINIVSRMTKGVLFSEVSSFHVCPD